MLRSAILLCPPADSHYLAGILKAHNPTLAVTPVSSREALDLVMPRVEPDTRLIAFLTGVVVPGEMLARMRGPSYNFHPAPPAYPGKHPVNFAVYDGATRFGATVHEMTLPVDSGPIVATVEFDVPPLASANWIKEGAYQALIRLFLVLAPRLATSLEPLPRLSATWGERRCSQAALDALCALPPDIGAVEFDRRVRAFGNDGVPLSMTLHGRRFLLTPG